MWNPFSRSRTNVIEPQSREFDADFPGTPDFGGVDRIIHTVWCQTDDIAQVEKIGTIAVATMTVEELARHRDAALLADLLDRIVESGAEHVVIDLQNVMFMDSGCVGCLVDALNRLSQNGGRIALANPASSVTHMFRMTRLDRVFPICADVLAAIKAVERGR